MLEVLSQILVVKQRCDELIISTEELKLKVLGIFDNDMDVYNGVLHQCIVSIYNRYTNEEIVYNPLRSKRPLPTSKSPEMQR